MLKTAMLSKITSQERSIFLVRHPVFLSAEEKLRLHYTEKYLGSCLLLEQKKYFVGGDFSFFREIRSSKAQIEISMHYLQHLFYYFLSFNK